MLWLLLKHEYVYSSKRSEDWLDQLLIMFSQPGLALLTLFLSRIEVIKQTIATSSDVIDSPSLEESQQWYAGSSGLDF